MSDEDADEGRVVFCDRTYQRTTSMFDDQNAPPAVGHVLLDVGSTGVAAVGVLLE